MHPSQRLVFIYSLSVLNPLSTRLVGVWIYGVHAFAEFSEFFSSKSRAFICSECLVYAIESYKLFWKAFAVFPVPDSQMHAAGHLLYRSIDTSLKIVFVFILSVR